MAWAGLLCKDIYMAKSSKFRHNPDLGKTDVTDPLHSEFSKDTDIILINDGKVGINLERNIIGACLLYTSPSPRDVEESRMPSSA